ncbi:hypothetical protein [Rufibacter ruber]|uniref:hypothetical protein n=1 Tax=Rufibacter ruber TaxID=1783499 RepID=UPI0012903125|nr:hypothetical protein [Rufibacter ruber]
MPRFRGYTKKSHLFLLLLVGSFFLVSPSFAQVTYTSKQSGNFNSTATWGETYAPGSNEYNNGDSRVPSIVKYVIKAGHNVTLNIDFALGNQANNTFVAREIVIEDGASLSGSGRLTILNNNSKLTNHGTLSLSNNFTFGVNRNDSAFFLNNGSATISSIQELGKGSILNNGELTITPSIVLKNITFKNAEKATISLNGVHINVGSTITNSGSLTINSTATDALNINSGLFYNYGRTEVKGTTNLASGPSSSAFNNLTNHGYFKTSKTYFNNTSSLYNKGEYISTVEFLVNQGIIVNESCAYLEQSTSGQVFEVRNSVSSVTNKGFIKVVGNFNLTAGAKFQNTGSLFINGNLLNVNSGTTLTNNGNVQVKKDFTNMSQAVYTGSGKTKIEGYSMNSDQARIEGSQCVYDPSAASAGKIVDEPSRNGATVAATVTNCGNYTAAALCCNYTTTVTGPAAVTPGSTVTYSTGAISGASSYTWTVPAGWTITKGAGTTSITVKVGTQNGEVKVQADNTCGTLAVTTSTPPVITGQPQAVTICAGLNASFTVTASGSGVTYQWEVNKGTSWEAVSGATLATLTLTNVEAASNGYQYRCVVTGSGTILTSDAALLTVNATPSIVTQPASLVTNTMNSNAIFTVSANGYNLTYQWQVNTGNDSWVTIQNGGIYSGATTNSLKLTKITYAENNYSYRCVITGCSQQVVTNPAILTVGASLAVNLKVLLEGPYNPSTGLMSTSLNQTKRLPFTQPYNFGTYNYAGNEAVASNFFSNNPDIVDWILVEIRTELDPRQLVSRKACFLKKDGLIVDLDGKSLPDFLNVVEGNYYVVVIHRNHLPIISKKPVNLTASTPLYDFSEALEKASGVFPQQEMPNGKFAMYAGDGNGTGSVTTADWNECWIRDNQRTGYQLTDFNMDGVVNVHDYRALWLKNNGKVTQAPR